MSRKKPRFERKKKSLFFWGCEGQSEHNYALFLNKLFDRERIPFRLSSFNFGDAGSVEEKIFAAKKKLVFEKSRKKGSKFKKQFLIMDIDQLEDNSTRISDAEKKALRHKIIILWQRPCFEGFLIKHFEDCKNRNPPNCREAEIILKSVWRDYKKPETVQRLDKKLEFDTHVKCMLTVDAEFKKLFDGFGLRTR